MLRLRKQIRSYIARIGCLISKNQNFAWSGDGINAYITEYRLFGQSHIDISRTNNFVYLRNALRTESHGCNRLGSPYLIDLIYPGFMGCN